MNASKMGTKGQRDMLDELGFVYVPDVDEVINSCQKEQDGTSMQDENESDCKALQTIPVHKEEEEVATQQMKNIGVQIPYNYKLDEKILKLSTIRPIQSLMVHKGVQSLVLCNKEIQNISPCLMDRENRSPAIGLVHSILMFLNRRVQISMANILLLLLGNTLLYLSIFSMMDLRPILKGSRATLFEELEEFKSPARLNGRSEMIELVRCKCVCSPSFGAQSYNISERLMYIEGALSNGKLEIRNTDQSDRLQVAKHQLANGSHCTKKEGMQSLLSLPPLKETSLNEGKNCDKKVHEMQKRLSECESESLFWFEQWLQKKDESKSTAQSIYPRMHVV